MNLNWCYEAFMFVKRPKMSCCSVRGWAPSGTPSCRTFHRTVSEQFQSSFSTDSVRFQIPSAKPHIQSSFRSVSGQFEELTRWCSTVSNVNTAWRPLNEHVINTLRKHTWPSPSCPTTDVSWHVQPSLTMFPSNRFTHQKKESTVRSYCCNFFNSFIWFSFGFNSVLLVLLIDSI